MRVAILGAGFIGKALIESLLKDNISINVLDRNICPESYQGNLSWIKGDVNNPELLQKVTKNADIVYHLISTTVPGDEHVSVASEIKDNVLNILDVIEVCRRNSVKKIVFASSASVYGLQEKYPITEDAVTNPISTHGIHKLMIEKFLLKEKYLHGLDVRILRISNPYGPGQDIKGRQGFVAMVIGKLLEGEEIILRDNGSPIRDFIYIEDLSFALKKAGLLDNIPSILNVGTGIGTSLKEVVSLIEELIGRKIKVKNVEPVSVDIPVSILDTSSSEEALKTNNLLDLKEGLKKTLLHHGLKVCESEMSL